MSDVARMRDIVVVGGGCYGTFYASQLAKARARGKTAYRRLLIVDRDPACRAARELEPLPDRELVVAEWADFFDGFMTAARRPVPGSPADYLVPSPHTPHLMFEWLLRRARARWPQRSVRVAPVPGTLHTPYDRAGTDGTRYVSFADWVCPTHCIEPAVCPAIGAPRTWEMGDAVRALADRLRAAGRPVHGPALFVCRHHVFGVGTFGVGAVLDGDELVARAGATAEPAAVLVGTISSCHGAVSMIEVGGGG